MLSSLAHHRATATFFVLLTSVRRSPGLLREVAAALFLNASGYSRRPAAASRLIHSAKLTSSVVDGREFEHASIPATITGWLLPQFDLTGQRSPREKVAETFLDLLTLQNMRANCPAFGL